MGGSLLIAQNMELQLSKTKSRWTSPEHMDTGDKFLPMTTIVLLGLTVAWRSKEFTGKEYRTQDPMAVQVQPHTTVAILLSSPSFLKEETKDSLISRLAKYSTSNNGFVTSDGALSVNLPHFNCKWFWCKRGPSNVLLDSEMGGGAVGRQHSCLNSLLLTTHLSQI